MSDIWLIVGEWVGGLATAGAVFYSARQYKFSRKQVDKADASHQEAADRRRSAAYRQVTGRAQYRPGKNSRTAELFATNNSDYAMSNVHVILIAPDEIDTEPGELLIRSDRSRRLGQLDAGVTTMSTVPIDQGDWEDHFTGVPGDRLVALAFTDPDGRSWWRVQQLLKTCSIDISPPPPKSGPPVTRGPQR